MNELQILIYSLVVAALLPYLAKAPLALAMHKSGKEGQEGSKGYNNKHPREQQRSLTGFGARCLAAHENSFESLILFAPAVLLVIATGNVSSFTAALAGIFVVSRLAYLVCYWLNWDIARSTVWLIGIVSSVTMMIDCAP
ncbi:MAPEG family protein [Psychrosphaera sp.]|nr:MAPEG family protein [Psychrosphaera sp.]